VPRPRRWIGTLVPRQQCRPPPRTGNPSDERATLRSPRSCRTARPRQPRWGGAQPPSPSSLADYRNFLKGAAAGMDRPGGRGARQVPIHPGNRRHRAGRSSSSGSSRRSRCHRTRPNSSRASACRLWRASSRRPASTTSRLVRRPLAAIASARSASSTSMLVRTATCPRMCKSPVRLAHGAQPSQAPRPGRPPQMPAYQS
jgi:hypothetical protein